MKVVNNLFYNHQYGFREGHTTELAAREIVDRVIQNMGKDYIPLNVYLDLSKAFDTGQLYTHRKVEILWYKALRTKSF